MFSDILEPRLTRVELSLAEENLIEQISTLFLKIVSSFRDIDDMLNDLFNNRLEIMKHKVVKLLAQYRDLYDEYRRVRLYLARVSIAMQNPEHYLELLHNLSKLLNNLYSISIELLRIASIGTAPREHIVIYMQKIASSAADIVKGYSDALKTLIESPSKFSRIVEEYSKILRDVMNIYEELVTNMYSSGGSIQDRELLYPLVTKFENIIKVLSALHDDILCLQILRQR